MGLTPLQRCSQRILEPLPRGRENLETFVKHTRSNTSRSLRTICGLTDRLKDLWIFWREIWKNLWLHQLKELSNNFFKYTGLHLITKHQPHNLQPRCLYVGYGPFTTNYSRNRRSLEEHASYPQNDIISKIKSFTDSSKTIFFWGGRWKQSKKRVGKMIYIIKCPQFTRKRHLNQLRKRLTVKTDGKPPEQTVMDVIYNTFDIATPLAASEMRRSKRKRKTTYLIVVNPKRIRYWDQKQIKISQSFYFKLGKTSQPSLNI